MASAAYSEDLTCPVCQTIFADPVTLLCGHSFCRDCIAGGPSPQCPQCETAVPELCCPPTTLTLKRLAEKAKEAEKMKKENGRDGAEAAKLCPEHEEKLKLFCVTDQQLACIICRDAERHNGHKFKPVKEAAASLRRELEGGMEGLCSDIVATESLAHTQRAKMTKTTEKSQQLATQIHRQFEEMHQFLRKREDEVKNELRCKEEETVERMRERLDAMETALSQSRELEGALTSVLQIEDSEGLLRSWTEGNSRAAPERLFRPRANDLQVVNASLSLGPYESHLQFFVWKEMLQLIQPRAELLSLKTNSADITVSDDGRSLLCTPKSKPAPSRGHSSGFGTNVRSGLFPEYGSTAGFGQNTAFNFATGLNSGSSAFDWAMRTGSGQTTASSIITNVFSVNEFTSGQHYWETEVGLRDYWALGIKDHFLNYDGQKYSTCSPKTTTELALEARPRKIGIYLNCSSKKLSFYDADNMTHIHTLSSGLMSTPLSAHFNIRVTAPDRNPLTVCWY
ncbi:nuclear factor 7, ovary-like [Cebidichthys violaceus]|uniref:nuclear factor 7, ovary-like n=1 Tax=Cebidichthys violaceus TaxID=271503 RepID=UPI0035CC0AC9